MWFLLMCFVRSDDLDRQPPATPERLFVKLVLLPRNRSIATRSCIDGQVGIQTWEQIVGQVETATGEECQHLLSAVALMWLESCHVSITNLDRCCYLAARQGVHVSAGQSVRSLCTVQPLLPSVV